MPPLQPLTARQALFVDAYMSHFRAGQAMAEAGYASCARPYDLFRSRSVRAALEARWHERVAIAGSPIAAFPLLPPNMDDPLKPPGFRGRLSGALKPLSTKQLRFVDEYMIDLDAVSAARRAGYSQRTSSSTGHILRRAPHIARAIDARIAIRADAAAACAEHQLAQLSRVSFSDPAELFDPDGEILAWDDIPDTLRSAITWEVRANHGKGGYAYLIKPLDKLRALIELGRRHGLNDRRKSPARHDDWRYVEENLNRHPGAGRDPFSCVPIACDADAAASASPDVDARSAMGPGLRRDDGSLVWSPLPGPQSLAFESTADVIGFGGAAGGGKTDLALGLALMRHRHAAIFRREATQLSGIVERLTTLCGGREGYNATDRIWRLPGDRRIEFGSTPHAGDELRHQGRAKDLLVLDEAAHFLESQARFLMAWVRSAEPGRRCATLLTFNPPTSAEGRWIIDFFAPWLDPAHPNPAKSGELRWFARVDGKDVEVEDGTPFTVSSHLVIPTSRTFIASRLSDNPHLEAAGYRATLQALPEPLRSQMLDGDFSAGIEDDPWQVIPTAWVEAAMDRWLPAWPKPMDSMGVDVARGGRDKTVIARRHGVWIDTLAVLDGPQTPDGPSLAGQVMARRADYAVIHIDVIGWGSSPYDVLKSNGLHVVAVNGAASSSQKTTDAGIAFANMRAQLWWRLREALDPRGEAPVMLPPDPALKADLTAPRWRHGPAGIHIEAKEDLIRRLGRSPDRGDAVCLALMSTPKIAPVRRRPREMPGTWMG